MDRRSRRDEFNGSVPQLVAAADCSVWSPAFEDLTSERMAEANSLGIGVIPWVINEPDQIDRLLGMGVAGIITDYPDRRKFLLRTTCRFRRRYRFADTGNRGFVVSRRVDLSSSAGPKSARTRHFGLISSPRYQ